MYGWQHHGLQLYFLLLGDKNHINLNQNLYIHCKKSCLNFQHVKDIVTLFTHERCNLKKSKPILKHLSMGFLKELILVCESCEG